MKIQKVLHACDDKEFYLDFWPIVSKIWKTKFNIEPVLLHFGTKPVTSEFGTVVKMPVIPHIPVNTQSQCARYWFPATEPQTTWMTSDIDMIPISKRYFVDCIRHVHDHKFVALNGDPNEKYPNRLFSCCYNIAKGQTFVELLELPDSFEKFMEQGFWKENTHNYTPDGLPAALPHWGADEMWSSRLLNKFSDQSRIDVLYRDCGRHECHRIDRINWSWTIENLRNDQYYDCHALRPYKKYKKQIDDLVTEILKL